MRTGESQALREELVKLIQGGLQGEAVQAERRLELDGKDRTATLRYQSYERHDREDSACLSIYEGDGPMTSEDRWIIPVSWLVP